MATGLLGDDVLGGIIPATRHDLLVKSRIWRMFVVMDWAMGGVGYAAYKPSSLTAILAEQSRDYFVQPQ
jgi:hypothetical protein